MQKFYTEFYKVYLLENTATKHYFRFILSLQVWC